MSSSSSSSKADKDKRRLEAVVLDALVVLKIMKHCKENLPDIVTGQLLGLDVNDVLEVTNSFPFPNADDEDGETSMEYQFEMMRCLREVNVDSNTVGWYQSTYLGSFLTESMIEAQFNYQSTIRKCVVIIYDPLKTSQGTVALQAFRLTQPFMTLFKNKDFGKDALQRANVSFNDIFEEVPIRVHNSVLTNALVWELESADAIAVDQEHAAPAISNFLEKNLAFLIECVDDLSLEQNKFQYFQRQMQRQTQLQEAWLARRRADNVQRQAEGLPELPEDDPDAPMAKRPQEPSRLEALLLTNQINNYAQQINQFSSQTFTKLFLLEKLNAGASASP